MTYDSITHAREARDEAMQRVSLSAENLQPGFGAAVYRLICDYAGQHSEFNAYEFRQHLAAIGFPVEKPKALGSQFAKAVREGIIAIVGYDRHPERHCSPSPRYRACRS